MTFKEIFEMKNTVEMIGELTNQAIPYYQKAIKNNTIDDLEECKYLLLCLDKVYQNGQISPLRDSEYDELLELYLDNGGEMIRGDMSSGNTAKHVFPNLKGTIKKVHYVSESEREDSTVKAHKSLENWLMNSIREIKDNGVPVKEISLGFYAKFDGLSVVLEVDNKGNVLSAITRGDKELGEGQNKLSIFKNIKMTDIVEHLKFEGTIGVKCEAIVSYNNFSRYNSHFGSNSLVDPRSAATAIMNSDNPTQEELKYLTLIPLMVYMNGVEYPIPSEKVPIDWVEDIFPSLTIKSDTSSLINKCQMMIGGMTKIIKAKDFPYPCDGIVIRILDPEYRRILGRNEKDCINNWERAYKFPPETKKSKIIDIQQEIGLMGKVSFTAKIVPVEMKNRTIKSVSLGSGARFKELNLAVGDEVKVQYDIIPYLTVDSSCKRSGNDPIEIIDHCPYCGEELEMNPELSCTNRMCPARAIGRIYNYCVKTNMDGIGQSTIEDLYNHKIIEKISDLYTLGDKVHAMLQIPGFGKKTVTNILDEIEKTKKITPSDLLGCIGIPSIGRRVFEKVLEYVSFDDLMDGKYEKLKGIPGVKSKTIKKIAEGLEDNKDEIKKILKHIKLTKKKKSDMIACFTKVRNKAFEKFLESTGVEVTENFNKNVNLLIVPNLSQTSSKIEKAYKWRIPIMEISEAYKKFGFVEE